MDLNRKTAMETLIEVETKQAYSNIALNAFISANNPDTEALVREIVYGVLRNKLLIDYILSQLISTPLKKLKPQTLTILRMGLYQLIYMNSVPEYAAVNESVNLAKKFAKGQSGFVNGVLRNYVRKKEQILLPVEESDPVRHLSIKYSYSEWIVRQWLASYERDFVEALLAAGNDTPRLSVRVNRLKVEPEILLKKLAEDGYEAEKGRHVPEALYVRGSNLLKNAHYLTGEFSVQDESSMLAVELLDPKPGETIIDVCAAPGGKTLFIGEKMANKGRIIAWDLYEHKLELMKKAALRNGITIIETLARDSTNPDPIYRGTADRVLVDAPCSGLGVIRRKPEIKYAEEGDAVQSLSSRQLELLLVSGDYVRAGGVLLYSTCTISREENQDLITKFLSRNTGFEVELQKQLFPNIDGTDGFFICKMIKKK